MTGAPVAEVGPEDAPPSTSLVGGVDGSPTVWLAVAEGELLGDGASVRSGAGSEVSACGAAGGCVPGSEAVCFPEHAATVKAVREERVRAVRRLTGLVLYFIRT